MRFRTERKVKQLNKIMAENITTDKYPHQNVIFIFDNDTQKWRGVTSNDFLGIQDTGTAPTITDNQYLSAISGNTENLSVNVDSINVNTNEVEQLLTGISGQLENLTQATGEAFQNYGIIGMAFAQTGIPGPSVEHNVVTPWYDEYGRQVTKGYNSSLGAVEVEEQSPALIQALGPFSETGLTAPGFTSQQNILDYELVTYQATVSAIDTNVVLNVQQSADGSNWFIAKLENSAVTGMSIANNQATITENGTYGLTSRRQGQFARLQFESESGGTNAVVNSQFLAGR